jgi:hypothetical protein
MYAMSSVNDTLTLHNTVLLEGHVKEGSTKKYNQTRKSLPAVVASLREKDIGKFMN